MFRMVLAFVIGVVVAAGVAVMVVKRNQRPAEQPAPAAAAVEQSAPAQQAALPAPETPAPAPVNQPAAAPFTPAPARKPAAARRTQQVAQNVPPQAAAAPEPQPAPPAPAVQRPEPAPTPAPAPEPTPAPVAPPPPPPRPEPKTVTIPGGTTVTVRLAQTLNSDRNKQGDTFTATLDQPLVVDGFVLAERGARAQGRVVETQQAGRVKGVSHMAIQLTSIRTSDGQNIAINTQTFAKEGEKETGKDAAKVGAAAAIGAAIGAIAGGGKGAAIGAGVGGAAGTGGVMATRGKPVELKVETRLTFRINEPVIVTEKLN